MKSPLGVLGRPFDFLVAFICFAAGLIGFFDADWPPAEFGKLGWILIIEDGYLVAGGALVMTALLVRQFFYKKWVTTRFLANALIAEMFAWMFIAFSTGTISLTAWWLPPSAIRIHTNDDVTIFLWAMIWGGVSIASTIRWRDLRKLYKGGRHG